MSLSWKRVERKQSVVKFELFSKFFFPFNIEFLPEWERLGRIAGYERNTLIINEADCVIAFLMKGSCGTWDSVRKAWAMGKQAVIIKET
jgi:hypothetical protein